MDNLSGPSTFLTVSTMDMVHSLLPRFFFPLINHRPIVSNAGLISNLHRTIYEMIQHLAST
jgi:hypothetical protein